MGKQAVAATILIGKVYKERVIYMQNAHKAQDNVTSADETSASFHLTYLFNWIPHPSSQKREGLLASLPAMI